MLSGFIFWIDCSLPFGFVLPFNLGACVHFDFVFCFATLFGWIPGICCLWCCDCCCWNLGLLLRVYLIGISVALEFLVGYVGWVVVFCVLCLLI